VGVRLRLSLLILFHSVFWLGVFRVPITLGTVLPCLIAASAGAAWLERRSAIRDRKNGPPQSATPDRILVLSSGLVGAVLLARIAISPLIGFDTRFRWDFLAQRLLALGRFDFYPPLTPADFRTYFFVDGIPPLVSFTHWWLYASAGRYLPSLICIFVAAQFACTLAFTYGAASAVYSRRAGVLAMAILAACPLYFKSVILGQETGLTALSIAAMVYFVVTAGRPTDFPAMISAGLAAALCALSREYGWIALIAGAIGLLWRRQPLKQVFAFGAVATAVAAPWYIRNWILTGNPFYSLRFGDFPVNPIHDGILQYYNSSLGVRHWTSGDWAGVLWLLLSSATLQVLAGLPGGIANFRRRGYLMVIALLLAAVWMQSVGYTSGGIGYSIRVLSPAMVVLSITGAGILEPFTHRARWRTAMVAAIVLCQIWTAAYGVFYPQNPLALPPSQWRQQAFRGVRAGTDFEIGDQLVRILPAGSRVLSDSAYLHAALIEKGIEVVSVWSPEVRFIFSSSPEESARRLTSVGIGSVALYPQSLNTIYLVSTSPLYNSLPRGWRVLAQITDVLYILAPEHP
jgi:Dolichyl-phosphate-mannose-protein mannosyltransferase